MEVLMLAIASFVILAAIVVPLRVAHTLESRAIPHKTRLAPASSPMLLTIAEAFDPVYSVLWEAPIAALKLIGSAGVSGIPAARLRPIYEKAAARFPEMYEGYNFLAWLQFLEDIRMIGWNGGCLVLTPDGQAFVRLRFIADTVMEA